MSWTQSALVAILSGVGCLAYATGYDVEIYHALMNFSSDSMVYLIAKGLEYFVSMVDILPDYSFEQYEQGAIYTLAFLSMANTIFPIVELVRSLVFVCAFYMTLILIRIIFKLVPALGG